MDKNIAAILREDARTIGVTFGDEFAGSKSYTYITDIALEVGDTVIVPSGSDDRFKMATVDRVDDDLEIQPNANMKYRWIAGKVDFAAYQRNMERNAEIEKLIAKTYRTNARQAYAQQFLVGAAPEVVALVKGA
jgi:hypothetical protein